MPPPILPLTITTTLTLLSRFQTTLSTPPPTPTPSTTTEPQPSPLPLLRASALTTRSHVTKLSLLTITSPLTPSAIIKVLNELNTSAIPSLVTGALLCAPDEFTRCFHDECITLSSRVLKTLADLIRSVEKVSEAGGVDGKGKGNSDLKEEVTSLTGRVWEACDALDSLSDGGIVGFVTRKVEEYHALVKDAISELEEWDPEDDDDETDVFGSPASLKTAVPGSPTPLTVDAVDENDTDDETIKAKDLPRIRTAILKLLRTTQLIYPAATKRRLKTFPAATTTTPTSSQTAKLDALLSSLKSLPDTIDELAESLYEKNGAGISSCVGKMLSLAEKFKELGAPWSSKEDGSEEEQEDEFTRWVGKWGPLVRTAADEVLPERVDDHGREEQSNGDGTLKG